MRLVIDDTSGLTPEQVQSYLNDVKEYNGGELPDILLYASVGITGKLTALRLEVVR